MKFNFLKKFRENKKFYRTLVVITIPIVIQNLIASSINMLDTVMIGNVGQEELAAVGIANQYYFLFSLAIFGVAAGCGVFIAQLWGKKDIKNIKSTLGVGLISSVLITLIFVAFGIIYPREIMGIFSVDKKVIELGRDYLLIVSVSFILTAISFSYASALRSVRNSSLPMWASVGALIVNGVLNYVLIFGKLGFSPMGVRGAAIATLTARTVEVSILIYYIYGREHILKATAKELFNLSGTMVANIFKVATPIILNDICFGLSTVTYSAIYGRIGTEAIATIQICTTVFTLFLVLIYGLANSAVVVVGNEIGAGRSEQGKIYA
ncbi:MAG: MATE family efflux transporter, partial [Fusobacteriaceae bacterium]